MFWYSANRLSKMIFISFTRFKNEKMGTVIIHTINTEPKEIKSMKGEKIHELLNFFLTGLRKRSRYLLAVSHRSETGKPVAFCWKTCKNAITTVCNSSSTVGLCELFNRGEGAITLTPTLITPHITKTSSTNYNCLLSVLQ